MTQVESFRKDLKDLLTKHNAQMSLSCWELQADLEVQFFDPEDRKNPSHEIASQNESRLQLTLLTEVL